jgi:hypothetical protein
MLQAPLFSPGPSPVHFFGRCSVPHTEAREEKEVVAAAVLVLHAALPLAVPAGHRNCSITCCSAVCSHTHTDPAAGGRHVPA